MDTATVILAIVSIVSGKVCLLVGLWLRLRWRTRHEQVQRQHLTSVTRAIAEGGQAEVVEQRPDGHSVRIKITRSPGETNAA
ncbi:hypothetical protein AB4212_15460 [Streptomyces sp. 2MCAF27]